MREKEGEGEGKEEGGGGREGGREGWMDGGKEMACEAQVTWKPLLKHTLRK
jgi:hypothetical protein